MTPGKRARRSRRRILGIGLHKRRVIPELSTDALANDKDSRHYSRARLEREKRERAAKKVERIRQGWQQREPLTHRRLTAVHHGQGGAVKWR